MTIEELKSEVDSLISTLDTIALIIMDIDSVLNHLEEQPDDEFYYEMMELFEQYEEGCIMLEGKLKEYFILESEAGLPVSLYYKGFYKKLIQPSR